jgi:hypothetical protein
VNYQGPLRTYDPNDADLFIVPYPGGTHFNAMLTKHRQNKIKPKLNAVQHILLDPSNGILPYYNQSTKHRHLFLSLNHLGLISQQPLVTDKVPSYRAGQIVTPQVNTNREYQPNVIQQLHTHAFFEQKQYAVAAIFSPKISGNSHDRVTFLEQSSKLFGGDTNGNGTDSNNSNLHLHGLPVKIITLTEKRKLPNEQQVMQIYRESIFCPCFRGDGPEQKRFIDAILSGCIPVVMSYEWDDEDDDNAANVTTTKSTYTTKGHGHRQHYKSYFSSHAKLAIISKVYPWSVGSFFGPQYPDMGIDYSDIVVEINSKKCAVECIPTVLGDLLKNPDVLRKKQEYLANVATLLTYGMEHNSLQYVDSITAVLVMVKHYIRFSPFSSSQGRK